MAQRRRKSRAMKIQPAVTDIQFTVPAGGGDDGSSLSYIDTAKQLSKINRRSYSQARMYAYQGLTFIWRDVVDLPGPPLQSLSTIEVSIRTAGNTWVVQNAHVKGHALWNEMQRLVLKDNPSIKGKWHDFKIRLIKTMSVNKSLECVDGQGDPYDDGEWNLATYVLPQHDVDPDSGEPEPALEVTAVLIGDNGTAAGILDKVSLVKAYEESRATVQADMPNVPAGLSTSFFNLLTDSGSQEPELADVIIDENDNPPYSIADYAGGDTNAPVPVTVGFSAISPQEVDGRVGPFVAPCGLLEIEIIGRDADGEQFPVASMPEIGILLHVAPGMYKGVASVPMGQ